MNIIATLIVSFVLNGTPQRISVYSSSIESCVRHDSRTAEAAVRAMGGTDVNTSCYARLD
jgi:hypothetical protein